MSSVVESGLHGDFLEYSVYLKRKEMEAAIPPAQVKNKVDVDSPDPTAAAIQKLQPHNVKVSV